MSESTRVSTTRKHPNDLRLGDLVIDPHGILRAIRGFAKSDEDCSDNTCIAPQVELDLGEYFDRQVTMHICTAETVLVVLADPSTLTGV